MEGLIDFLITIITGSCTSNYVMTLQAIKELLIPFKVILHNSWAIATERTVVGKTVVRVG
jgi:acyl-homoserine lactone acylase PvdQ